jgi:hypothetical protein
MGRLFRILSGFILACFAAALTMLLFAFTPSHLSDLAPEIAGLHLDRIWALATHTAIFAFPFAVIPILLGEVQRWRDWAYYAAVGIGVALLGFWIQVNNETGGTWSVLDNNGPLLKFLTEGFVGGLVYWLVSGRLAGHHLLSAHGRHGLGHGNNKPVGTTPVKMSGGKR